MAYTKQTWANGVEGGTPRSAARLNHQEDGIQEASDRLDAAETDIAGKADTDHNHTGTYQPLDSDLTTIAGLSPTNGDLMARVAGAWAGFDPADLPVSDATQTALNVKADAADLTAHEGDSDPHTQYQLRSEKDQPGGYAGLEAGVANLVLPDGGAFRATNSSAGALLVSTRVTGDTNSRLGLSADGSIWLGPGDAATDTQIRRGGDGEVAVEGDLHATGATNVGDYPLSEYGLVAATASLDTLGTTYFSSTQFAHYFIRVRVPANTLITGACCIVGSTLGSGAVSSGGGACGFSLYSSAGTRLAQTANDYTFLSADTGLRTKDFSSSYTTGDAPEWLYIGFGHTYSTSPLIARASGHQAFNAHALGSTHRRGVFSNNGGSATPWQSTINLASGTTNNHWWLGLY